MYRILVADDEREVVEILQVYLEDTAEVIPAFDGLDAYNKIKNEEIHMAILDIMMPGIDGFKLTKTIRETLNIPILILSAKNQDYDKILGLGLGADDYITKPFNPLEVVARVKANLRRVYSLNPSSIKKEEKINVGEVEINITNSTVTKENQEIALTSVEYKILKYLMINRGRVVTKKQIYIEVWGEAYIDDFANIMVHISNIREKIEDNPKKPRYIKTIRGLGYKFEKRIDG